ncbi:hypothetical protein IE53DRAFT_367814 [Violaceomyces palustris]|uniref:Uncharacterized protein n=1 Tax=Violaceomyces palustris TaxID=1673888 RepID=A0ACD0P0Y6_9BASI|nr:hypothetical protein IE53DRAFT_367814 [Violaceomyces palustris]
MSIPNKTTSRRNHDDVDDDRKSPASMPRLPLDRPVKRERIVPHSRSSTPHASSSSSSSPPTTSTSAPSPPTSSNARTGTNGTSTTARTNGVDAANLGTTTLTASNHDHFDSDGTAMPVSGRRYAPVVGPDGKTYTPGEAAKLGLTIRTACDGCRTRKLKCSGTKPEQGGCVRCRSDGIDCVYSARAPIGRPRKRKASPVAEISSGALDTSSGHPSSKSCRKGEGLSTAQVKGKGKARMKSEGTSQVEEGRIQEMSLDASGINGHVAVASGFGRGGLDELASAAAASFSDPSVRHGFLRPVEGTRGSQGFHGHSDGTIAFDNMLFRDPNLHSSLGSHFSSPLTTNSPATSASGFSSPDKERAAGFSNISSMAPMAPTLASSNYPLSPPSSDFVQNATHARVSTSKQVLRPQILDNDDKGHALFEGSFRLQKEALSPSVSTSSPSSMWNQNAFGQSQRQNSGASPFSFGEGEEPMASLDDLSIAAFLQSLDTLEIAPSDGLTQSMLAEVSEAGQFGDPSSGGSGLLSSSAILQDGLSYAVPADFSWWDLGLCLPEVSVSPMDSNQANQSAFNLTEPTVSGQDQPQKLGQSMPALRGRGMFGSSRPARQNPSHSSAQAAAAAASEIKANWPRGSGKGMGNGSFITSEGQTLHGAGWDDQVEVEGLGRGGRVSPDTARISRDSPSSQAWLGKEASSPDSTHDTQLKSCCSKKAAKRKEETCTPTESEIKKPCCTSKEASDRSKVDSTSPPTKPSSLSLKAGRASSPCSMLENATDDLGGAGAHAQTHTHTHGHGHVHSHSKVHCVPNPSGKGCTCLCDMSVALLSVRRTLRQATDYSADHENSTTTKTIEGEQAEDESVKGAAGSARKGDRGSLAAATTLQLTLSASQAVAEQCACSADCPTCRSDPSTELSASLLVSTALQIYARAVKTLREGFTSSSSHPGSSGGMFGPSSSFSSSGGGGLDIRIGDYRPGAANARRIALFAMKLELRDLRTALGKISKMATSSRSLQSKNDKGGKEDSEVGRDPSRGTSSSGPRCSEGGEKGWDEGKDLVDVRLQGRKGDDSEGGGWGNEKAVATTSIHNININQNHANANANANLNSKGWMNPIDQIVIMKLHQQLGELLKTVESLENPLDPPSHS